MISIEDSKSFKIEDIIEKAKVLNEEYKAIVTFCDKADSKNTGELKGVAFTVKDNILTKDVRTTACSKTLEDYYPYEDAKAVRLLKDSGAVMIGKSTMDEFAFGSTGESAAVGDVALNPLDTSVSTGGSSSGSAVCVACGMTAFSLGSDTSGSVRQPAAFCKVVGVKPSYGTVSSEGLFTCVTSMDCIGVLASGVEDSAKVLSIISQGKVKRDIQEKTNITVGIPKEYFDYEFLDKKVKSQALDVVEALKKRGCTIVSVDIPSFEDQWVAYSVIGCAEVSSNFGKVDGIKFGYRGEGDSWEEIFVNSRTESFGQKVKERIIKGTFYLGEEGYSYLLDAQRIRTKVIEEYNNSFTKCDVLVTPTVPTLPFKVGKARGDEDVFTVGAGLAGLPAISVPYMDTGIQVMAKRDDEANMFAAASLIEKIAKEGR